MHLYQSNINLKNDVPYSMPLPYASRVGCCSNSENADRRKIVSRILWNGKRDVQIEADGSMETRD